MTQVVGVRVPSCAQNFSLEDFPDENPLFLFSSLSETPAGWSFGIGWIAAKLVIIRCIIIYSTTYIHKRIQQILKDIDMVLFEAMMFVLY